MVLHGLFEHSRRYEQLGETMAAAGIATFALDQRGHGLSGGRRGHVTRFEQFMEDTERFRGAVAEALPDRVPVFLLAHSMGGLVGLRYLQARAPDLAGAIVSAPWLGLVDPPSAALKAAAMVLNRLLPILPFPAGLDADDLSHDPERVADYRNDPLIFATLTPRLNHEVERAGEAVFRDQDRLGVPLLFLVPGEDRIIDAERTMELARSLDGPDVTVRLLEGYYHEVLQEVDRATILAEIREWIEARVS